MIPVSNTNNGVNNQIKLVLVVGRGADKRHKSYVKDQQRRKMVSRKGGKYRKE